MRKIDDLVPTCRKLLTDGGIEPALLFLRENGCGKFDSIRALVAASGMSLADAKTAVHYSRAWDEARARDEALWDELIDSIKEIDNEQS